MDWPSQSDGHWWDWILCISIIGIPFGIQAFKMAGLTLTPFGKTVQYGGGVGSALANILWVVLVGCWMALGYLGAGVLNCITIIGIPFGIQSFKVAKLALLAVRRTDLRVCNNCFCSRSGAAHYHRALHRTFIYNRHFTHRDLTDSDVRPYSVHTHDSTHRIQQQRWNERQASADEPAGDARMRTSNRVCALLSSSQ